MNVQEAIKARRSIRKYQDKEVPEELVNEMIEAARLAPSGSNRQGARYKVVTDKDTIQNFKQNSIFLQEFVYTAPCLIICCYDRTAYPEQGEDGDEQSYGTNQDIRCIRDLSIASSFIVLRAQELGLGTCYIGWMDKEKTKTLLNLPENIGVLFTITVGYPDEEPAQRPRLDSEKYLL